MGIIDRIEEEIVRLNEQILDGSSFENRDSVNLNAMVCLLRYAAWKDPQRLKEWFTREGTETSVNPNVVKRFSLYENERNPDGAQLRIHIFDDAEETAKHDHQRDFITMCIQGAYEYRYYRVDSCDDGGVVQYFNRIDGEFVKANPPTKPGKIVRVKHTNETWDDDNGERVGEEHEMVFDPSVGPLYVNSNWIHTVSPKYTEADSVITVLIRRQKKKDKKTIFIRGPNDKEFEEEEAPIEATSAQIDDMFEKVRRALVGESTLEYSGKDFDSNVITEFMNPRHKLVRVSPEFIENGSNLDELINFMELNDFSFCPVVEKVDGIERFVKFLDHKGNSFFSKENDWMDSKTPILFGILYTVLSKRLVIPIVDNETKEFHGILSLFDIVKNVKRFARMIVDASIDSNENKAIQHCAELISGLNELQGVAIENRYHIRGENPDVFNKILTPLGKLILNKDIAHLVIQEEVIPIELEFWIDTISNDFFQVNDKCKSIELLSEINEKCDFSTFVQRNQDGSFTKVKFDSSEETMKTIPENSGPRELIDSIKNGMWPVYANIESKNQIKIISTDELFSYHSLSGLVPELEKIDEDEKIRLLNRLLLKSSLKNPMFDSVDFDDVIRILK
ncbi:MAG: hypothetical protein CMA02_02835 [Euryarchaeota archaeon]|nr:hypothetical protein [Euryarchaeota archaeon]